MNSFFNNKTKSENKTLKNWLLLSLFLVACFAVGGFYLFRVFSANSNYNVKFQPLEMVTVTYEGNPVGDDGVNVPFEEDEGSSEPTEVEATFTVALNEGYKWASGGMMVSYGTGGETVEASADENGVYTLKSKLKSNETITVGGMEEKSGTISLSGNENLSVYTLENGVLSQWIGASLSYTSSKDIYVKAKSGYDQNQSQITANADNATLISKSDEVISGVTYRVFGISKTLADSTIVFENFLPNKYSFSVISDYSGADELTEQMDIYAGGTAEENKKVLLKNTQTNTYEIKNTDNTKFEVDHGNNINFYFKMKGNFTACQENVVAYLGDSEVTTVTDGDFRKFIFENLQENKDINFRGVAINRCSFSMTSDCLDFELSEQLDIYAGGTAEENKKILSKNEEANIYEIKNSDDTEFEVNYGGSATFYFKMKDGFTPCQENVVAYLGDSEVTTVTEGDFRKFTLASVQGNTQVNLRGVVINKYKVRLSQTEFPSQELSNMVDVHAFVSESGEENTFPFTQDKRLIKNENETYYTLQKLKSDSSGEYEDFEVPHGKSAYFFISPKGIYDQSKKLSFALTDDDAQKTAPNILTRMRFTQENDESAIMTTCSEAEAQTYTSLKCVYKVSGIVSDKYIAVGSFETRKYNFSVGLPSIENIWDRVTVTAEKNAAGSEPVSLTDNSSKLEDIDGNSGVICTIKAGNGEKGVDGRDIDLTNSSISILSSEGANYVIKYFDGGTGDYTSDEKKICLDSDGIQYIKFRVTDFDFDLVANVSDVPFRTFGVKFYDDDNLTEELTDEKVIITQSGTISEVKSFTSGQEWKFDVKFSDFYEGELSADLYTEGGEHVASLEKVYESGIHTFTVPSGIRYNVKIKISGIAYKKLDLNFSISDFYNDIVGIEYREYNDSYEQSGAVVYDRNVPNFIPYGKNFKFKISLKNTQTAEKYNIDASYIRGIINYDSLVGISCSNISAVNVGERAIEVTLENVTDNADISITRMYSSEFTANVKLYSDDKITEVGPEVGNQILVYSGSTVRDISSENLIYKYGYGGSSRVNKQSGYSMIINLQNSGIDVDNIVCSLKGDDGEGYENVIFSRSPNPIADGSYVYTLNNSQVGKVNPANAEISIKNVKYKSYKVNFEGFTDIDIYKDTVGEDSKINGSVDVDYGGGFKVILKAGPAVSFEGIADRITLSSGLLSLNTEVGVPKTDDEGNSEFTFLVTRVVQNSVIKLKQVYNTVSFDFPSVQGMEYYAATKNGDGFTVGEKIQGRMSCNYGSGFAFAVKATNGYNLGTVSLINRISGKEDEPIEPAGSDSTYKYYYFSSATADKNIVGQIQKNEYTVKLNVPQIDGQSTLVYKQNGSEVASITAQYASDVSFSIELAEKFSNSDIKVNLYTIDGQFKETLNRFSGVYKITNVSENLKVEVEGVGVNNYVIGFEKNSNASYLDANGDVIDNIRTAAYGETFYFMIESKNGYTLGDNVVVKATSASGNSKALERNSIGQYKLPSVKDNYTISVSGIDSVFYTLNFAQMDGVTYYNENSSPIKGSFKVGHGKNYEFSIEIDDAYSESLQGLYIVANDKSQSDVQIQKLSANRYLIQNITQDITIRIANLNKNIYGVTLTGDEGIDYLDSSDNIITGDNKVQHGENFSFKVKLYPAYMDSNIRVMLGNQEISKDSNGFYVVENVVENKTVTVVGIGKTDVTNVIEAINALPTEINDDTDLEAVIKAVRAYNALSDSQKANVGNYYVLEQLQEKVAQIIHTYNGVTAEGLDWNIKLIANPIISDMDACARIYEKIGSEYILSLYDVYLWDVVNNCRYKLPEGKIIVLHLPTPDMTYFENSSGIHENADGKIDYLTLNMGSSVTSLETSSLSPIGIIAHRSIKPGRSSLVDAVDADIAALTGYKMGSVTSDDSKKTSNYSGSSKDKSESGGNEIIDESENKVPKNVDNSTTSVGSALKLMLILMIIFILLAIVAAFVKKYKG